MYLLDTNTLIYFFKGQGQVATRLLATPPAQIAVPALSAYEIEVGIARSADPAKRREQWWAMLKVLRLIPFAAEEAQVAAMVQAALAKAGTPIGPADTLIAGTALAHDAVLVTRNTREFSRVSGLKVVDWF